VVILPKLPLIATSAVHLRNALQAEEMRRAAEEKQKAEDEDAGGNCVTNAAVQLVLYTWAMQAEEITALLMRSRMQNCVTDAALQLVLYTAAHCCNVCRLRRCAVLLRRSRRRRTAITNCVTIAAVQLVLCAIALFVG
jgi:hypothetical protein